MSDNLSNMFTTEELYSLCNHEWAFQLLEKNIDQFDELCWEILCQYKWALPLLIQNDTKISDRGWSILCRHGWALPLLVQNANKIGENISLTITYMNYSGHNFH